MNATETLLNIPIAKIRLGRNPRTQFDETKLDELPKPEPKPEQMNLPAE